MFCRFRKKSNGYQLYHLQLNRLYILEFRKKLSQRLGCNVDLVINENRSTMINVLEYGFGYVRLSLHRMFLEAPDHVVIAIADYIGGARRSCKKNKIILRDYIEKNSHKLRVKGIDRSKLRSVGSVYDLNVIYRELNDSYFGDVLDVGFTWHSSRRKACRRHMILGQYCEGMNLIKVNDILDDTFFPKYFVSFIMYHEMLHALIPGYLDERGRFRLHGLEFKRRERLFAFYRDATVWGRKNKERMFVK